jgi:hypothetical protein
MVKIVDAYGRELPRARETFTFVGRKAGVVVARVTITTTRGWALARRDFKALHRLTDEEVETIW